MSIKRLLSGVGLLAGIASTAAAEPVRITLVTEGRFYGGSIGNPTLTEAEVHLARQIGSQFGIAGLADNATEKFRTTTSYVYDTKYNNRSVDRYGETTEINYKFAPYIQSPYASFGIGSFSFANMGADELPYGDLRESRLQVHNFDIPIPGGDGSKSSAYFITRDPNVSAPDAGHELYRTDDKRAVLTSVGMNLILKEHFANNDDGTLLTFRQMARSKVIAGSSSHFSASQFPLQPSSHQPTAALDFYGTAVRVRIDGAFVDEDGGPAPTGHTEYDPMLPGATTYDPTDGSDGIIWRITHRSTPALAPAADGMWIGMPDDVAAEFAGSYYEYRASEGRLTGLQLAEAADDMFIVELFNDVTQLFDIDLRLGGGEYAELSTTGVSRFRIRRAGEGPAAAGEAFDFPIFLTFSGADAIEVERFIVAFDDPVGVPAPAATGLLAIGVAAVARRRKQAAKRK